MKVAFSICSNNYLAQAKTLQDSVLKYGKDYIFYIFLVDEFSDQVDYNSFKPAVIKLAKELPIDFFSLRRKYNIIELNTSIKASCVKYIFNQSSNISHIHYFDPDIEIFQSLDILDKNFAEADFLLTPHIMTPIEWGTQEPNENLFLNHGLFNLGYIGLKNTSAVRNMLDWWENRTLTHGYYQLERGLFVDQLWMNYIPLFYPGVVKILFDPGYNMGPWNLHERKLTCSSGDYKVNEVYPLIFYHFSSYKYTNPKTISRNYRYDFTTNPELLLLYESYHKKIIENHIVKMSSIACAYYKNSRIVTILKRIVYYLELVTFKLKYYLNPK